MSWTNITKPTQGDPTRKATADAIIDNLAYLKTEIEGLSTISVPNTSFEVDVDANNIPDRWVWTPYSGGTGIIETSTSAADGKSGHGARSFKITHPGGGGNGGGYLESEDFLDVAEAEVLILRWQMKATVAGMHNQVIFRFYDSTGTFISAATIFDSTANPTAWREVIGGATPPANARLVKIRLVGGNNDTSTGGVVNFDGLSLSTEFPSWVRRWEYTTAAGTFSWLCPAGVYLVQAAVTGGGGGGADGNDGTSQAGGGGGGGGTAVGWAVVVPGTSYSIVVGAAGTGAQGSGNGVAGGNSTAFGFTGGGGSGGVRTGPGGSGGTGTGTGVINLPGTAGTAGVGAGGSGVGGPSVGQPAAAGLDGSTTGGAGGHGNTDNVGLDGKAGCWGQVIIQW